MKKIMMLAAVVMMTLGISAQDTKQTATQTEKAQTEQQVNKEGKTELAKLRKLNDKKVEQLKQQPQNQRLEKLVKSGQKK